VLDGTSMLQYVPKLFTYHMLKLVSVITPFLVSNLGLAEREFTLFELKLNT
jgi:hypothetical protein